ncbi:hypothetical protein M409DRAFT_62345 [Zasmidium cellare ATCC 36951]|uniref:Uncharacterized protein n=1 Tax=Zasmidium cellare ATCC 36951 TaxID=1080233 RepID=A0A6A6D736_ZASCE|nr:uncharacterized protein M409DRAFT_62345 [Zasmidium cellare ATCC 36951]KAF2174258.1 hypothetical protein M409DRAFT_62345 [Zasmidium cellare ATCC 36951]
MSCSAFSEEQILQFLNYIKLPRSVYGSTPTPALLNELHIRTISCIPYENLSLHYNPAHRIDLDPPTLFTKIVENQRGRGGYCMEVALIYYHVLLGLGFDVYPAPAKARARVDGVPSGDWGGWIHITCIVTFPDGSQYSDDVGFGGDGPTAPLPLLSGRVHENLGAQEVRLIREWLQEQKKRTDERDMYWVYQYRNSEDQPWRSFYAFLEIEFLPKDWAVVNWFTGHNAASLHFDKVLVVLFLIDGEAQPQVVGKRMLVDGTVKENLGGKTSVVVECRTEQQRIAALREYFGIALAEEESEAMHGWRTELDRS